MNARHFIANVFAALSLGLAAFSAAAVDVNKASQAELETVKGIGPGLSAKILKAREAGSFKSWDDFVERVGGVGAGNAGKFSQAGLTVGGNAYNGSGAAPKAAASDKPRKADKADKGEKAAKADKAPAV
jgi:competence protein ComEA